MSIEDVLTKIKGSGVKTGDLFWVSDITPGIVMYVEKLPCVIYATHIVHSSDLGDSSASRMDLATTLDEEDLADDTNAQYVGSIAPAMYKLDRHYVKVFK